MRRTPAATVIVLALTAVLALALIGCGSDGSEAADATPAPTTTLSAQQLLEQSLEATGKVTSASFTADLALQVEGDSSQMDPSAQAMLGDGVKLHVAGKSAQSPVALDMTMDLAFAGQTLAFQMIAQDKKAWVKYQDTWYAIDEKTAKSLGGQAAKGATPTEQLQGLGMDPDEWGATYELVGAEEVGGTPVYHVKAAVDPEAMAKSLLEALKDPALAKQLGQSAGDLEKSLEGSEKELQELQKSLKDASADFWIGADDLLLRKATMVAGLDMSGQTDDDLQGVGTVGITGTVTMADFDEPVTVTPPADALPFEKLMESLFGGMLSGGQSGMSF